MNCKNDINTINFFDLQKITLEQEIIFTIDNKILLNFIFNSLFKINLLAFSLFLIILKFSLLPLMLFFYRTKNQHHLKQNILLIFI
ncbi:hypothetical protein QV02_00550 [Gallibacterium anatis]|uniref:Transmembrane protein n=1 Tax=Gallibacterium anatis TaxID=750 RepID=A0A1A7P5D5_9PAST|nr:hypothetical protein QV02_00550 [Gallibacterium anatis]OBW98984.1 hypothetical protein QV03_04190 [Gallibacterium anatis]